MSRRVHLIIRLDLDARHARIACARRRSGGQGEPPWEQLDITAGIRDGEADHAG